MSKHGHICTVLMFIFCTCTTTPKKSELQSSKDTINRSKTSPEVADRPALISPSGHINELAETLANNNQTNLIRDITRSIFQDSKGNFWFGTLNGVFRYNGETLKRYSKIELIPGHNGDYKDAISVHAIAEDKNGNMWFGTDQGAIKYDGKTFNSYTEKNGLSNIRVGRKSILVDKSGKIWVGTESGVFLYDPLADGSEEKCFSLFHLLPPENVKAIMEDTTGNIWFASEDNGVFRYDGRVIKNITGKDGLGDNYAGGMAQDKTGDFWFTMKGGICRYDGKKFTEFTTKDGLGGSEVGGIYLEKSGIIWITARGSTTRYDPSLPVPNSKAFTVYTEDDINCCVQSMYQDRSGNMWWGTGNGVYRFDGKHFYRVERSAPC